MKGLLKIFFVVFCLPALGQDIHFSQYFNAPLLLNPANAGNFHGDWRFQSNFKNQWSSIGGIPYRTYNFSADRSFNDDKLTSAIQINNDKSGLAALNTTSAELILGSSVLVKDNQKIRFGIGTGFVQRTINYSELTWNNQYNGYSIDKSLPSGENTLTQTFSYFDFSSGIVYSANFNDKLKINTGVAIYHITAPKQKFSLTKDPLYRRLSASFDLEYHVRDTRKIFQPSVIVNRQGKLMESVYGLCYKYILGMDSHYTGINNSSNIGVGLYYRTVDAFVVYFMYSHKNRINVGASYDINTSKLKIASQYRGGVEFSISYKIIPKIITTETVPSIE